MLKRIIPRSLRRLARKFITELPHRLRDLPADLLRRDLPGATLRYNVAGSSSRRTFVEIGTRAASEIAAAIKPFIDIATNIDVLDFGCGCGRVIAPLQHILADA